MGTPLVYAAAAVTSASRDKILKKINRRLPADRRVRVMRGDSHHYRFVVVDATDNIITPFSDARALAQFAIDLGAV